MASGNDSVLHLEAVSLTLQGRVLIPPTSVEIRAGVVRTIMGPSGSGKSSLLDFICGTLSRAFKAGGRVLLDGREITRVAPEKRGIGILFQDDLLFPHMSVGENLLFALPRKNGSGSRRRATADAALAEAGLEGFFDRDPATLSGGQRARVAVMRTLLSGPRALLLDEPFSKLDARTKAEFREFVFSHARMHGLPTLLVTHDPEDARAAGGPVTTIGSEPQGD
jgi:putative thiamine transport system ATP-binding protein